MSGNQYFLVATKPQTQPPIHQRLPLILDFGGVFILCHVADATYCVLVLIGLNISFREFHWCASKGLPGQWLAYTPQVSNVKYFKNKMPSERL